MLCLKALVPRSDSGRMRRVVCLFVSAMLIVAPAVLFAAAQNSQSSTSQTSQQQQQQKPPATGEAGGPTGDLGPIAIPKKPGENTPPPPPARKPQQEKLPEYTIT